MTDFKSNDYASDHLTRWQDVHIQTGDPTQPMRHARNNILKGYLFCLGVLAVCVLTLSLLVLAITAILP